MGVWFPSPHLAPDEAVVFQAGATHLPNWRSIGGQVTVTDRRLLFVPHWLDTSTGGHRIEIARDSITSVRVLEPGRQAVRSRGPAALLRPQLAVEWQGTTTVLVVRNLNALQAALVT